MSFLSVIENFFSITEKDVVALVLKIKHDIDVTNAQVKAAMGWIANATPQITKDIQTVESIVQVIGVGNPTVAAAVAAANVAVAGLNAYATAYNNGTGTPAAVVAGYSAAKLAQAAAANAASVAVAAPVTAPAPASSPAVPSTAASLLFDLPQAHDTFMGRPIHFPIGNPIEDPVS